MQSRQNKLSECQQCALVQIRAAALTATQCASYDLAKQWWMRQTGMRDNVATHLGASMLTGLATTTITAPVDLVKTNMFVGEPSLLPWRSLYTAWSTMCWSMEETLLTWCRRQEI